MDAPNHELVARQLLRALRAHRSQVQWSRWLGYQSNVAYAWESGRRYPTAAEALRAARRGGLDVNAALQAFYGKVPPWTDTHDPCTPEGVAALLDDLRGQVSITDLARRAGLSRHSVSRWLSGRTQPRLPDFLGLVEAASLRMVDLVVALVGPEAVPSLRAAWERLEARRAGAARFPWLQAVLRVLELERYRARPAHDDDWVARQLGIEADQVRASIEFLLHTGQVRRRDDHIVPEVFSVDTRGRPEVSRALKSHWTRVAAERIDASAPGQFSYNVFTVSEADFERIRQLHLDYFRALRAIVAESEPGEVVAVANVQLFGLHGGGE
jgi:transcriptional regulator with XRE-family HTH domain